MKHRHIAIFLAAALLLTLLAGCGGQTKAETQETPAPTEAPAASETPVETEAPAETEAPEETSEPEEEPEEEGPVWDEPEETEEPDPDKPVERQVKITSSRKEVVIENEIITLYCKLIGFDGVNVRYQWQVDRGDGEGWVDVEGANGPTHSFVARKDTILYSWRLTVSVDE
jgi:type IV secretory pathway VirB10-like protein